MPGMNGTGPDGLGPMTGGGFGRCTDSTNSQQPRGRGLARGRRRGNRYNTVSNTQTATEPDFSVPFEADEKQVDDDAIKKYADIEMQLKEVRERNEILSKENEELKAASSKSNLGKRKKS